MSNAPLHASGRITARAKHVCAYATISLTQLYARQQSTVGLLPEIDTENGGTNV